MSTKENVHWATITTFVTGIVVFLMALTEPEGQWDKDAILGGMLLGTIPVGFGLYSLSQASKNGRWMSVTGLSLGIIVLLVALGSK